MLASKVESNSRRPSRSTVKAGHGAAIRGIAAALAAASAMAACLLGAPANAADPIPAAAAAAGYRMETLASDSFSPTNVDMKTTYAPGYQWYFMNFFGLTPLPGTTTFNADGSVNVATTITGWTSYGAFLSSAGAIGGTPGFRGTAYGGGGYFEATFAFNNAAVNTNNGWPAWWAYALEQYLGKSTQWAGQRPGYRHFIETDFFEYDAGNGNQYGGNLHDWYGVNNSGNYQLPWSTVVRLVPSSTNFNQYHRYGFLWKPATPMTKGAMSYYFDGVQVGPTTYYSKFTNQAPPPGANTPWTFGVTDQQHLVLILSTGPPVPLQVKSVQVWQASAINNRHN
jgi:hypothetical protein